MIRVLYQSSIFLILPSQLDGQSPALYLLRHDLPVAESTSLIVSALIYVWLEPWLRLLSRSAIAAPSRYLQCFNYDRCFCRGSSASSWRCKSDESAKDFFATFASFSMHESSSRLFNDKLSSLSTQFINWVESYYYSGMIWDLRV